VDIDNIDSRCFALACGFKVLNALISPKVISPENLLPFSLTSFLIKMVFEIGQVMAFGAIGGFMVQEPLDPRVQKIIEEETLRARIAHSLAPKRATWLNENSKWLLVSVAIPFTTFLFGYMQERSAKFEADSREGIAEQRIELERELSDARNNVSALTALLPALSNSDPNVSSLALIIVEELEKAQRSSDTRLAVLRTAVQLRIDNLRKSSDPGELKQAARQQELLSQATGSAPPRGIFTKAASMVSAATVQQAAEIKPRLVYIQFYNEDQREQAASVQQLLRAAGVGAPGIEKIPIKSGARIGKRPASIFYFNTEDLGGAKWLQQQLIAAGIGDWAIVRSSIAGVPAGQIELWWPKEVEPDS
jgi:hypothetical protein